MIDRLRGFYNFLEHFKLTYNSACIQIDEGQKRNQCREQGVQDYAVNLVIPFVFPRNKKEK